MRFLTRVVIQNFKSIAACDVTLGDLTCLVGPNGSGKSNFLDALEFVSDALNTNLAHAIRVRGGLASILRGGLQGDPSRIALPHNFGIRVEFDSFGTPGHYSFEIAPEAEVAYLIAAEECVVGDAWFRVGDRSPAGTVGRQVAVLESSVFPNLLSVSPDQLSLSLAGASNPVFQRVYGLLMSMKFYNLVASQLRRKEYFNPGWGMASDGANAASTLLQMSETPDRVRILEYLKQILPTLIQIDTLQLPDSSLLLRFEEEFGDGIKHFFPHDISDGTMRALGILLALFRPYGGFIGIEEPETALHPGASAVLLDALREASEQRQVLVTTHSPDLLDLMDVHSDTILAVSKSNGGTVIAPIDSVGLSVIREGLYKPGELMRMEQLIPATNSPEARETNLFDLGQL